MRTRSSRAPLRCTSGSLLVNGKHTLPPLIQLRHFARRERARPRHPLRSAPNLPEVSAPDAPLLILAIGLQPYRSSIQSCLQDGLKLALNTLAQRGYIRFGANVGNTGHYVAQFILAR